MTVTKQSKFNKAMASGRQLTVPQIKALGFANAYDPAYKARNMFNLNVQRFLKTNKRGVTTSFYAIESV